MNNQKDTQKTNLNSYGQSNVLDVKTLENKDARLDSSVARQVYDFANKKTEKLVTALYMVTDCMDTDDALKTKLRDLGVALLSDMYKLASYSPLDKQTHIVSFLSRIEEIISFVEISYTIGFISEMNTTILKKEFMILVGELESHQKKDKHFTFTLDEQMFSLPVSMRQELVEKNIIKDNPQGQINKRTSSNNVSFTNSVFNHSVNQTPTIKNHSHSVSDKKERTDKILSLIKGRDVSIKDISSSFSDCSEKTIQRELNALVLKGQVKKTGAKRWSRYQAIKK